MGFGGTQTLDNYANYDSATNNYAKTYSTGYGNYGAGNSGNLSSTSLGVSPTMNPGVTSQNTMAWNEGGFKYGAQSLADMVTGDYWDLNGSKPVGINGNTVGTNGAVTNSFGETVGNVSGGAGGIDGTTVNGGPGASNSWQAGLKGFGQAASGLSSLAGIYLGFQQLDIMKDQSKIAKDQWKETKSEMNRIKGVRTKLNAEYSGKTRVA